MGIWKNKTVKINKFYGQHEFTQDEQQTLLAGDEISFPATAKSGKEYAVKGKLGKKTYKGKQFVAFKAKFQ